MIKVNLLESVTDRNTGAAFVEDKVSSTHTQTFLLALTVVELLILGVGYDYVSASAQHAAATKELAYQHQLNDQMNAVKKEKEELEKKLTEINNRIDAIQKLRASQQGPSAVLAEIKARFDSVPGLYLKSVEQKDAELTIKGESPNEGSVTRFGQSMEFSSGLFSNLNIETTRQVAQFLKTPTGVQAQPVAANGILAELPEVVAFTIKCDYGPAKPPEPATPTQQASTTASHVAARN